MNRFLYKDDVAFTHYSSVLGEKISVALYVTFAESRPYPDTHLLVQST
jgi:hypothetical protein